MTPEIMTQLRRLSHMIVDCWLLTVDCRRRGGKTQWLSVNCWLDMIIVMQPETIWAVISY
jgi:hypothetical protein